MNTIQLENAFVQEILGNCLDNNSLKEEISEVNRIIKICKNSNYNQPLKFLLGAYEKKVEGTKEVLVNSPIGESGSWISYSELNELEHTWSGLEMGEILDWGYKPFKQRMNGKVKEYWVDYCLDDSSEYSSSLYHFVSSDKYDSWKKASEYLVGYNGIVGMLERVVGIKRD